jgi:predicted O-methyltransferase YrrM
MTNRDKKNMTILAEKRQAISSPFRLERCGSRLIEELYSTRRIPLSDGGEKPMLAYIPREEGDYLYSLVRHLQPELTVEIGMAQGLSTLFITQALKENGRGRHIAIDPFQNSDWEGVGMAMIERAGLESLVELIEKPSHQALPDLEKSGLRPQFIFIDGCHLFEYVLADFLCSDRILPVGGMIAFDDSDWAGITAVIRFILANRDYRVGFPEVVIEDPCYHPTVSGNLLRWVGKMIPSLGKKLRPDFVNSSYELGIRGRCVVLQKMGPDKRRPLGREFTDF